MLSRPHPVFGDWCYCQPGDSQRLLDRQLAFRDAELKDNPEFSGMPLIDLLGGLLRDFRPAV